MDYCCLDPCAIFLPNIAKLQGLDHPENVADFLSWLLLEATTTVYPVVELGLFESAVEPYLGLLYNPLSPHQPGEGL